MLVFANFSVVDKSVPRILNRSTYCEGIDKVGLLLFFTLKTVRVRSGCFFYLRLQDMVVSACTERE